MKKLMFSLAVACASALAAYADAVPPTWFDAAVGTSMTPDTTVGAWDKTTGDGVTYANGVITYKNMDADLTFTVADAKYLPADVATVNTTVKFTAMAMEDFVDLTNNSANVTAWADAKGGLTIIEEPDSAYKFYGLVGGTWQELADSTVKAADVIASPNAVPVEVKIWQNNGRKISYKVNNAFIGDSEFGLTASGTGTKISSIAYRGNCEIKSLTGDTEPEMWNLTLNNLLEYATATLKVGSATFDIKSGSVSITGTTEKVQVVYSAPDGKMLFSATDGAEVKKAEDRTKNLNVTGTESYDAEIADIVCATAVAKIVETGTSYKSLTNAIKAVANSQTVKVISAPENSALTIDATMTLDARNGESSTDFFTVAGDITIDDSAALTILGGNFSGKIDGQLLISGPSTFAQVDKDTASGLCATGWFAKKWNTTGAEVVAGTKTPVVIPGVGDVAYDPNEVSAEVLAMDKTQTQNGFPAWVNYAMGLDNVATTTEKPNIVKTDATETVLTLAPSKKGRAGTGFVIEMSKNGDAFDGDLTLAEGTYVIKTILTNGTKTEEVSTKKIGVKKSAKVTDKEATDAKLIAVPYYDVSSGYATIDTVLNKAELPVGAVLQTVADNAYATWTLQGDGTWKWTANGPAKDATTFTVKPGQGLWLSGGTDVAVKAALLDIDFFQYGEVKENVEEITPTADAWNLLANPTGAATAPLSIVKNPAVGDTIRIDSLDKAPQEYVYVKNPEGSYGWQTTTKVGIRTRVVPITSEEEIDLGDTVWFIKDANSEATIQW